jgi:hypothetical protein
MGQRISGERMLGCLRRPPRRHWRFGSGCRGQETLDSRLDCLAGQREAGQRVSALLVADAANDNASTLRLLEPTLQVSDHVIEESK